MVEKGLNNKKAKQLADEHWEYVKSLLKIHGETLAVIEKIGFHYKSAMIHGYGHGEEKKNAT